MGGVHGFQLCSSVHLFLLMFHCVFHDLVLVYNGRGSTLLIGVSQGFPGNVPLRLCTKGQEHRRRDLPKVAEDLGHLRVIPAGRHVPHIQVPELGMLEEAFYQVTTKCEDT